MKTLLTIATLLIATPVFAEPTMEQRVCLANEVSNLMIAKLLEHNTDALTITLGTSILNGQITSAFLGDGYDHERFLNDMDAVPTSEKQVDFRQYKDGILTKCMTTK